MAANGRLGGHIVQGHVDGIGTIRSRRREGEWETFWFHAGPLTGQLIPKGSIAIDGISLTVVEVTEEAFSVALIPAHANRHDLGEQRCRGNRQSRN